MNVYNNISNAVKQKSIIHNNRIDTKPKTGNTITNTGERLGIKWDEKMFNCSRVDSNSSLR